jgi:hypothetical protein
MSANGSGRRVEKSATGRVAWANEGSWRDIMVNWGALLNRHARPRGWSDEGGVERSVACPASKGIDLGDSPFWCWPFVVVGVLLDCGTEPRWRRASLYGDWRPRCHPATIVSELESTIGEQYFAL